MRFDWYAATIDAPPNVILGTLVERMGAHGVESTRGLHGYTEGWEIKGENGTVARVLAGGRNPHPHAWASGSDTDAFVEAVRSSWRDSHTVSRMDSAEDFQGAGADTWERLNAMCLAIADEQRLKVSQAGDYHRLRDGRTLYVGSKKSPVFLRLYEKGKQLRSQVTEGADLIPDDWCRLEVQVRPAKDAKRAAAHVSPEQAWGFAAWTAQLAERCIGLDVPRVQMHVWREADDARALWFMARQYGLMLKRLRADLGDWAAVGQCVGEVIDRQSRERS